MIGILLAVLASVSWGINNVVVRAGLQYVRPATGTLISLVSSFIMVGLATIFIDFKGLVSLSWWAFFWFALAGIFNFSLGRTFMYLGIHQVGASRASVFRTIAPFFSMIMAVAFLRETLTPFIFTGTILIVIGLYFIVSDPDA